MADLKKTFYINLGKDGSFRPSRHDRFSTTAEDVNKIFELLTAEKRKKILLYFHGGLVSAPNGMQTAERIVRYTAEYSGQQHPICFVWETGLTETLTQNFDTINNSGFFNQLLVRILKVAGKNLGIDLDNTLVGSKGVGSMTDAEIKLQLQKDAPFEDTSSDPGKRSVAVHGAALQDDDHFRSTIADEIAADLEEEISDDQHLITLASEPKPEDEARLMREDVTDTVVHGRKGILSATKLIAIAIEITVEVIRRHVRKRDHGFYPTVIEEILRRIYVADIGEWFWGKMKDKAKNMWAEDSFSADPLDWHAGTYLLKKLEDHQNSHGTLTIDLVGHSAGAIAICELIDAVGKRGIDLKFRNIIFMAPACRCELFAKTILVNQGLFEDLRIFTMTDANETKDRLVKGLYTRSLLYFISGVLEPDPFDAFILGLQRHITGQPPYDRDTGLNTIKTYLLAQSRMVYAVTDGTAVDGMRSGSRHHADFDNDKEITLDSIFYILNR